jgi:hypothetical protein
MARTILHKFLAAASGAGHPGIDPRPSVAKTVGQAFQPAGSPDFPVRCLVFIFLCVYPGRFPSASI